MKTRGDASLIILLALVLLGGGGYVATKKGWFSGETKRANESTKTTNELIAAKEKQEAVVAASVVKIGEANATAPDSPSKAFITREVPVALASLPPPDVEALIAAEKRKVAVMEGKLAEADRLYGDAMKRVDEYQKEAARAVAAKRASDLALQEAAKEARDAAADRFLFMLVAGAVGVLWLYTKLTHLSPGALANVVGDIRAGTVEANPAIVAIDTHTSKIQQMMTKANYWINSKLNKLTT